MAVNDDLTEAQVEEFFTRLLIPPHASVSTV